MKVFQIGVAGGAGRRLTQLLTARGDSVTGMHRDGHAAACRATPANTVRWTSSATVSVSVSTNTAAG